MTRQHVQIDRRPQFDLFGEAITDTQPNYTAPTCRQFIVPDPREIYLGLTRLEDHLQQAQLKEPFVVARLLNEQDWSSFEQRYAPSGRPPYGPRCMMGLILYGILQGVSSLRGLEKLARVDLGCMWVTGGICPDHANIGRFIVLHEDSLSGDLFDGLLGSVLQVTGSNNQRLAGDGTVIEAACSHFGLLKGEAAREQAEAARREAEWYPEDPERQRAEAQATEVADTLAARQAAKRAQGKPTDKVCISATEPDAMVQPLKRGRGKAPSYKPSVLANEDRVVVAHDVHPSSESAVVAGLLAQSQQVLGEMPHELLLDAGYFNDQVIEETLAREISLLCPEGKRPGQPRQSAKYFTKGQFRYVPQEDVYVCPAEQRLDPAERYQGNGKTPGYVMYRTAACRDCPLRKQCTRSAKGRGVRRYAGDEAKDALRDMMQHPQARAIFGKRQAMVEPVFSVLRLKQSLNRFRRRGLPGVKREFALHILAYNLSRAVALGALFCWLWRLLSRGYRTERLWRQHPA